MTFQKIIFGIKYCILFSIGYSIYLFPSILVLIILVTKYYFELIELQIEKKSIALVIAKVFALFGS